MGSKVTKEQIATLFVEFGNIFHYLADLHRYLEHFAEILSGITGETYYEDEGEDICDN